MKAMSLAEIARAIEASVIQGKVDKVCARVSTDTRKITKGDLFIALRGENFDAHNFLNQAVAGGATALVVHQDVTVADSEVAILKVKDTTWALQELAKYNRRNFDIPVIGVTGSNGKTTTKDMIASVLGVKFKTLKNTGNFNNHIGLPLTLLKLDQEYQAAVVEMGMRARGEIDELARIAEPTGAVITVIGETHLELLGTVENIALAKGEILDYIREENFAILNGDDPWQRKMANRCAGKIIYFGFGEGLDIRASRIEVQPEGTRFWVETPKGGQEMFIPIPGEHNVQNAMAAIGVGIELGLSLEEIKAGLRDLEMTAMRLEIIEADGYKVINDAYNASPASMTAALNILADLTNEGRRIAVLGNMFELGNRSISGHREVGQRAAEFGTDVLITVGDLACDIASGALSHGIPKEHIYSYETNSEALKKLREIVSKGDIILVKGSRGMKMEEIVQGLTK